MSKTKPREPVRRHGRSRTTRSGSAAATPSTVSVETLREQADRLGLLDPLEEEPANVFTAGTPESHR